MPRADAATSEATAPRQCARRGRARFGSTTPAGPPRLAHAAPDRTDGVDQVPGGKPVATRHLRRAGGTAGKRPALRRQFRPGGALDRAVDATAAEQRLVRGVDNGVELERGDVGDRDFQAGGADFGADQRSRLAHGGEPFTPIRPALPPANPRCCARRYRRNGRRESAALRACH